MTCPHCDQPYACPCEHCVARKAQGDLLLWIRLGDELEACPNCGVIKSLDEWFEIQMDQFYKNQKGAL